jgi:hypothetical protein
MRGDGSSTLVRARSIKDWILKALGTDDYYSGLVTDDVITAIGVIGGPEVSRSSITPQLSRLKADKLIEQEGRHWRLVRRVLPQKDETPGGGTPGVSDEDDITILLGGDPNPARAGA